MTLFHRTRLHSPRSSILQMKYPRAQALPIARELCDILRPVTDRLIVAGSLRRMKAEVGDVEIVFIPRTAQRPDGLFDTQTVSLADEALDRLLAIGTLTKRLNSAGHPTWGRQNKLGIFRGIPVDFFATTPDSWWNYLVCRTGPADLNARIATEAQKRGYQWNPTGPGFTSHEEGTIHPMDSEEAVFAFVGIPYAAPADRR